MRHIDVLRLLSRLPGFLMFLFAMLNEALADAMHFRYKIAASESAMHSGALMISGLASVFTSIHACSGFVQRMAASFEMERVFSLKNKVVNWS